MNAYFQLPSPFAELPGRVFVLETAATAPPDLGDRLLAGTYARPFVVEDHEKRSLLFNLDFVQSEMRLAAPDALDTPYAQAMMGFLLFHTNVRRLLLLGLGGGSLSKFIHRHLPLVAQTAVEADVDVLAFRRAFRIPDDGPRFRVVLGDAADFVCTANANFDVMLVDAYEPGGVSSSLLRGTFYANARRRLGPQGVLVANLAGDAAARRAHLDLILEAFGDNVLVVGVDDGANHVVFAFRDPRFEPRWKWIVSQAPAMRTRYGLDFPALARQLERAARRGAQLPPEFFDLPAAIPAA
jgi:spermidine synthase